MDNNLKMRGLIQAFSRTNRILNSIKTFDNIVCFRNLQKRVGSAISLFGDKNTGGSVLLNSFKDYYYGYESLDDKPKLDYIDYILMLIKKYHDTHCDDKEVLIIIKKAVDASLKLRSKKQSIETFIARINDVDKLMPELSRI